MTQEGQEQLSPKEIIQPDFPLYSFVQANADVYDQVNGLTREVQTQGVYVANLGDGTMVVANELVPGSGSQGVMRAKIIGATRLPDNTLIDRSFQNQVRNANAPKLPSPQAPQIQPGSGR